MLHNYLLENRRVERCPTPTITVVNLKPAIAPVTPNDRQTLDPMMAVALPNTLDSRQDKNIDGKIVNWWRPMYTIWSCHPRSSRNDSAFSSARVSALERPQEASSLEQRAL